MIQQKHQIDVQVEDHVGPLDIDPIRLAVRATLAYLEIEDPCEVVVVISDDAALRDLNRRFRGVDRATDVLSFANETRGPFAAGSDKFPCYLGDIVISVQRAQEQAAEAGGTLVQELQLLTVHGVLHLLGYDHAEAEEKARMWSVQKVILNALGVEIPLPE